MKATSTNLAIVAALMVLFAAVSVVSGDGICGMSQEELMDCKTSATAGTAVPPPPSKTCCKALGRANILTCLCSFKNNMYIPLLGINATRAMELRSLCTNPTLPPKPVACT